MIYSLTFSKCRWYVLFKHSFNLKGVYLKKTKIINIGKRNSITIGKGSSLNNCQIIIKGNDCSLNIIGGKISNVVFYIEDNNSSIEIGHSFSVGSGHFAATEGKKIKIGNDCMFSNDIEIRNGDSHSIVDIQGKRINPAKDTIIGNHVWLTAHVRIMKGSIIPDNCIIGNSSVVSSCLEESNSLYAGNPIKLLRNNISWERQRK